MTARYLNDPAALAAALKPGPLAIIRDEDGVNLAGTLEHAQKLGFPNILLIGAAPNAPSGVLSAAAQPKFDTHELINPLIDALAGRWIYLGFNAEYLVYPFFEGRTISDAFQFLDDEKRGSVLCTTVDLYPPQIAREDTIFDPQTAHMDISGYYSRDRYEGPNALERQIDIFGGLKWRYSEHVEWERQRIDRIGCFRAKPGLRLSAAGHLSDPEMNTISCPWHHNMTFCVASFRVAKSLLNNPGSAYAIDSFLWDKSRPFGWSSQELMDLGLMEPGQWF